MSFATDLINTAKHELTLWSHGDWIECVKDSFTKEPVKDKRMQPGAKKVHEYWLDGIGEKNRHGCINLAWSAAFICWCLRKSGMRIDQFPISGSHQSYIRWSINNTKSQKIGKSFYGRRVNEYLPKPGDLIAQWRKEKRSDPDPNISFDNQPDQFYISHCDIVISVTSTSVTTIGGNVGNKVKDIKFEVRGGLLVPKKEFICIMECKMH